MIIRYISEIMTIYQGQRSSSATAYLAPKYLERPNLSVLIGAQATRVIETGKVGHLPKFGAVHFASNSSGEVLPYFGISAVRSSMFRQRRLSL